jgi:hypothetical protein
MQFRQKSVSETLAACLPWTIELRHRDAAKREGRRVVTQARPMVDTYGIARQRDQRG